MQVPAGHEVVNSERIYNGQLKYWVGVRQSEIHGLGLFAVRTIAKDEYIGTYWGPEARRDGTYVLWVCDADDPGDSVGRSGRNMLRYLNHANPNNAAFDGFNLYAKMRIRAGAEITINYQAG